MTKRREIIRMLERAGFKPAKGANHEKFIHPDGREVCVPRHREIAFYTVRGIMKQAGIPREEGHGNDHASL